MSDVFLQNLSKPYRFLADLVSLLPHFDVDPSPEIWDKSCLKGDNLIEKHHFWVSKLNFQGGYGLWENPPQK